MWLTEEVETARAEGDASREARAEFLLALAYAQFGGVGEEQRRLERLHAERAEAAFRRAGDSRGLARALAHLAVLAAEDGDERPVHYLVDKLREIDERAAQWWWWYTAAILVFRIKPHLAAHALTRCLEMLDALPEEREHWRRQCERKLAFLTGEASPETGDSVRSRLANAILLAATEPDRAGLEMTEAMKAAEESRRWIRSEVKQRELSATYSPIYTGAAAVADREGRYEDALDIVELNTSRSLISRGAIRWLWHQSPKTWFEVQRRANNELLRSLTRWERTGGSGERQRLDVALRRRREAAHQVEEELVRLVPRPHQMFQPTTSSQLVSRLAADNAVVVFASFGPVYVIREGRVERVAEVRPEEVEAAAAAYAGVGSVGGGGAPHADIEAAATALVAACVDPLRAVLAGARRVFVVPSEALWAVPLATLGGTPLAERHAISYVPNLSMIAFLVTQERLPRRRVERFVGIADPDGTLPHAAGEVAAAASHFYDSAVLVGEEIERGNVLRQICDADVLHLACHAGFFREFPDFSYVHIAGRGDARTVLWASDLARLPLESRLVVLAACHAGTSVALEGDEYLGLPAAFLEAGALSVIAPLWTVDDRSTARFMTEFYDALEGVTPSVALWRAQCRVRAEPETAHPYYWAAFQPFGIP